MISDLRKHARSYENELDTKLVAFSKLGNSFAQDMERLVVYVFLFKTMIRKMTNFDNLTSVILNLGHGQHFLTI